MKTIKEVNAEDFDCTVESGVTRQELNSYIRDTGLQFPIGRSLSFSRVSHFICAEEFFYG